MDEDPDEVFFNRYSHVSFHDEMGQLSRVFENMGTQMTFRDYRCYLHIVAQKGDNEEVKILLDHGAKIGVKDKKGNTALHMAAEAGNHETVQLLLSKGAAVSAKDNIGNTPLHKTRSCEVAEILIRNGASARDKNELNQSALHCVFIDSPPGSLKEITELLIEHGAEVDEIDYRKRSPLFYAVQNSSTEASFVLIRKGANVNRLDYNGWSIMCQAIFVSNRNIVELLLNHGVSPNAQSDGGPTPLHMAAEDGEVDMILLMLQKGVKLDVKDEGGCTALHVATDESDMRVMSELLAHGFSISVKNNKGKTPYDYLDKENEPDCHRFLSTYVNLSKLAGLPMPMNADLDLSEEDKLKALEELERIKSTAIGAGIHLHNVFTECSRPQYLLCEGVMENIESLLQAPDFRSQFLMYANILKGTFIRAKKSRYYLTKAAVNSIMSSNRKEWCRLTPDLVWEYVFKLLEDEDLTNVVLSES